MFSYLGIFEAFPIDDFLEMPESSVTQEVKQARENLTNAEVTNYKLKLELEFLKEGLKQIFPRYPVKIPESYYKDVNNTLEAVNKNLKVLSERNDKSKLPIDCWNEPYNCIEISKSFMNKLTKINFSNVCEKQIFKI